MSISVSFAGFLGALAVVLLLTPYVARFAIRKKWVDVPGGQRTVHQRPTPRAGGLAVIAAFFAGILSAYLFGEGEWMPFASGNELTFVAFLIGGIAIALTGLYDDAYGLGFKKKFLFQLIVAYAMFLAGFRIEVPNLPWFNSDPYLNAALGLPLTLLWYIAVMNAVNLIDGLDGLASGISLTALFSLSVVFGLHGGMNLIPVAMIMGGALLGFLFYNFNPASIFLGDTGSLFIGFVLATFSLQGTSHDHALLAMVVLVLAIGFPILDTTLAYIRRLLKGQSPFAPDKSHIHHRLKRRLGLSTKQTVITLYLFNLALGTFAVLLAQSSLMYVPLILAGAAVLVAVLLRRLGYLKVQKGMKLVRHRVTDLFEEKIPRGKWERGAEPRPSLKRMVSKATGGPEKEKHSDMVAHSVE